MKKQLLFEELLHKWPRRIMSDCKELFFPEAEKENKVYVQKFFVKAKGDEQTESVSNQISSHLYTDSCLQWLISVIYKKDFSTGNENFTDAKMAMTAKRQRRQAASCLNYLLSGCWHGCMWYMHAPERSDTFNESNEICIILNFLYGLLCLFVFFFNIRILQKFKKKPENTGNKMSWQHSLNLAWVRLFLSANWHISKIKSSYKDKHLK